jgi:ATP-dependent Zn protease
MSIGKSWAKVYVENETGVTFDDIARIDEARAELMEIVDSLKNPERYRRLGARSRRACSRSGRPGPGRPTGAHHDLQRASDLVRHMVTQYGMSDELGLGTFEWTRSGLFLGGPSAGDREYSEHTARMVDAEMRRLLEAAHLRVQTTLKEKRNLLEVLAKC